MRCYKKHKHFKKLISYHRIVQNEKCVCDVSEKSKNIFFFFFSYSFFLLLSFSYSALLRSMTICNIICSMYSNYEKICTMTGYYKYYLLQIIMYTFSRAEVQSSFLIYRESILMTKRKGYQDILILKCEMKINASNTASLFHSFLICSLLLCFYVLV